MKKILTLITLFSVMIAESQSLPELYNEVKSSVVVINTLSLATQGTSDNIELVTEEALGSGVLISSDGLIWTASHVVQAAEAVKVEFLDGDVYEAEVLSTNPQADIALIMIKDKFELKNKKVAEIGNSDKVMIGEDVFVLGAPHGFKQSLSKGILSGRYSPLNLSNDFVRIEFLQTDAAVNPGNSGGPMFNMKGEVVAIASSIYTSSGGFEGIGFAISSNVAKKLLDGKSDIWSGMETYLLNGNMARVLNVPQDSGLLVTNVSTKGAASQLGLRGGDIPSTIDGTELLIGGDIILDIAGITLENTNSFFLIREKLDEYKNGDLIKMSFLRNGRISKIDFIKQ